MLKWSFNTLATWYKELTHWNRPWCRERLRAGGEGDDRRWDHWMASPNRWTWVWASSRSWWWTGKPGVLWFMVSQRVRHDWATELNWTDASLKQWRSWVPKNWCFWTVMLDCKEIQLVHSKGNQSWIFIGRTDAKAEAAIFWPPDAKNWLIGKDPDARKDWRQEEKGMTEDEMVGWHHKLNRHEFEQAPGVGDRQGSLACCSTWVTKSQTQLSNWTDWLEDVKKLEPSYIDAENVKWYKHFRKLAIS